MIHDLKLDIVSMADRAKTLRRIEERRLRRMRKIKRGYYRLNDMPRVAKVIGEHERVFNNVHNKRTVELRKNTRHHNLAYGFLRGTPYRAMEEFCYVEPDWDWVQDIASKHYEFRPDKTEDMVSDVGAQVIAQRFSKWLHDAGVTKNGNGS